jgi:polyribonucleotide nucleotidyltransferase
MDFKVAGTSEFVTAIPLEINEAILALVTATTVTTSDTPLVIAATRSLERTTKAFLRL